MFGLGTAVGANRASERRWMRRTRRARVCRAARSRIAHLQGDRRGSDRGHREMGVSLTSVRSAARSGHRRPIRAEASMSFFARGASPTSARKSHVTSCRVSGIRVDVLERCFGDGSQFAGAPRTRAGCRASQLVCVHTSLLTSQLHERHGDIVRGPLGDGHGAELLGERLGGGVGGRGEQEVGDLLVLESAAAAARVVRE